MILNHLSVSGWRCFSRPLQLAELSAGLNIVHGPNGVGKSSLFSTLVRIFGDRHKSKADPIRMLQPWGTDLSPRACVEFEHGGERWQIEKQFLHSPFARLSRCENGQWKPIAENEHADDRTREILQMETSRARAIEPEQWGLAQVLWAEQGSLQLGALSAPARTLIQQSLGAQVVGVEGTDVEHRVEQAYDKIFTTRGYRTGANGAPIVALRQQLAAIQQRVAELRQKLQSFDEAGHRINERRLKAEHAQREEQQVSSAAAAARLQATNYTALVQQRDLAAKEVEGTRAVANQRRKQLDEIAAARKEIATWQESLQKLQAIEATLTSEVEVRQKLADEATTQLKAVRVRREEIDLANRRVQRAERLLKARRQMEDCQRLATQVEGFIRERAELRQQRAAILAPDGKQLAVLRKAFRDRDDALLRFESSLITLEIAPEVPTDVDLTHGEPANLADRAQSLPAGQAWIARGTHEVALRLKGIATIRACGPSGSAEANRELWQRAQAQLDRLTASWQTQDLAVLETAAAQGSEIDQKLRDLETRIETLLEPRSLADVQRDGALAERQCEELHEEEPVWRSSLPDVAALRDLSEQLERTFKSEIDRAEERRDIACQAAQKATADLSRQRLDFQNAQKQLALCIERLDRWTSDGLSDEARSEAFDSAAMQFAAAQGQLKAAEDKLQAAGSDPRDSARLLQEKELLLRKVTAEARKSWHLAEGELRRLTEDSPYSALAIVEEEESRLVEEIARLELSDSAVKLLHDTLQDQRRKLVDSLVGPVQQRAKTFLERIVGSKFGELELNQQFAPQGVLPRDVKESVLLEQLSGGEQEQVHFSVRLALAQIAFPDGQQLIVLDDVFTFTDRDRLARVAQILAEMAEQFQIVLLTCHPERYVELTSAKFYDLAALTRTIANPVEPSGHSSTKEQSRAVPQPIASPVPPPHKAATANKAAGFRTLPGF